MQPVAAHRGRARTLAAGAAIVAVVLAGGAWRGLRTQDFAPVAPAKMAFALPSGPSIAVMPFVQTVAEGGQSLLGDGLAQDITAALTRFGDLTVISSESTAA